MGFGAEFKNMRQNGGAPKITESAAKEAEAEATTKATAEPEVEDPDAGTFQQPFMDGQTLGEASEADGEEAPVVPAPKPEAKKVAITLGGKKFDTVEEAMEYAAILERDLEVKEAYAKGLETAVKPQSSEQVKPTEVKRIKKIADKLFEDPDAAMEELETYILEMAEKRIEARENAKSQQQQQVETAKKTWENFYQSNNDLAEFRDEVQLITDREWSRLQHMPVKEGLEEIARLSRAYVSSMREKLLPKQNLPSRSAQTASQGGKATTATPQPATEKKISFAQQVRSTNKRTAMQGES